MKEQILAQANEILRKRREKALNEAESKEDYLNGFPDYAENEKNIRVQRMRYGIAQAKKENAETEKTELTRLLENRRKLLNKYGFSENDLEPDFYCKKCGDTGYDKINRRSCGCYKTAVTKILIKDSLVFNENCSLESINKANEKAYSFAKDFCEKYPNVKRRNVLFSGKTGTGKTYLATAMANRLMAKQVPVLFLTSLKLSEKLMEEFLSEENSAMVENVLAETDVLVIDDFGLEPLRKSVTAEYFMSMLNDRIYSDKTTIITTNLDYQDLMNRYGERLMSRLADENKFFRVELFGDDKRAEIKKTPNIKRK